MEFSISKSLLSRENFRGENSKLSRNTAVRAKVMELRGDRGERVAALEAKLKVAILQYIQTSASGCGKWNYGFRRSLLQTIVRSFQTAKWFVEIQ